MKITAGAAIRLIANFVMAAACTALDYFSKQLALTGCVWGVHYPLLDGFLGIELALNQGVAFSLLVRYGRAVTLLSMLVALLAAILLVLSWFMVETMRRQTLSRRGKIFYHLSSAVLLGGVLGNAIDRWRYAAVIDFISVHWRDVWYFPIFNVADILITLGVAGMLCIYCFPAKCGVRSGNTGDINGAGKDASQLGHD